MFMCFFFFLGYVFPRYLHSFPTRRSSDLVVAERRRRTRRLARSRALTRARQRARVGARRSEEHTSELQSLTNLVCRLLLEKKNYIIITLLEALRQTRRTQRAVVGWTMMSA